MEQKTIKKIDLPDATVLLIMGIFSIILCGIIGLGLAIAALILGNKRIRIYEENPEQYTNSSYSNIRAGRTCAIIGLIIQSLVIVGLIIYLLIVFAFVGIGVGMSQGL